MKLSVTSIESSSKLDRYVHCIILTAKRYCSKATKLSPNCAQTTPQIAIKPTNPRLYVDLPSLKLANATT